MQPQLQQEAQQQPQQPQDQQQAQQLQQQPELLAATAHQQHSHDKFIAYVVVLAKMSPMMMLY